jgi:hypothetical protein
MDKKLLQSKLMRIFSMVLVLSLMFPAIGSATAAGQRTFVGTWQAIDNRDGSLIRVVIAGPAKGPFTITWTDNYFSFCDGGAGLATGKGKLDPTDPNILKADMLLKCSKTGATTKWQQVWQYRAAYDVLASQGDYGVETIWTRAGVPSVLRLDLRVNYGHNWVESFYPAGHKVLVIVRDGNGNVKAKANVVTAPQEMWSGETGFQTAPEDWSNEPPDIQPYDWVYAYVDNGQTAKVQIGDINGVINLEKDSITGTIDAPWFASEVDVECHSWGKGGDEIMKYDRALPDGIDPYSCAWDPLTEWDIQYYQDVGVGYFGLDGHWVANAFFVRNPRITTFTKYDYIEGWEWPLDSWVHLEIDDPDTEANPDFTRDQQIVPTDWDPNSWWTQFNFGGEYDLKVGDVVTISGSGVNRSLIVRNLDVVDVNESNDTLAGIADPGTEVHVWPWNYSELLLTVGYEGTWLADFGAQGIDLVEGTCGRAEIRDEAGNATAVDWCVPNPYMIVFPDMDYIEARDWPKDTLVQLAIDNPTTEIDPDFTQEQPVLPTSWDPSAFWALFNFGGAFDMQAGDEVTLSGGGKIRTYTVMDLAITSIDKATSIVSGTVDPSVQMLYAWVHDHSGTDLKLEVTDGVWTADFASIGFELQEGMCGRVTTNNGASNATAVDWCVPVHRVMTMPDFDEVYANGWPEGSEVSLTINGQFIQSVVVAPAPWDANDIRAYFSFGDLHDLQAGDSVVAAGSGAERSYTVLPLSLSEVSEQLNRVSGTAENGAVVHAWVHGFGETEMLLTVEDGTWLADFGAHGFDLLEGMCGRAEIRDELGNTTTVDWCIPNPRFTIFPDWNYIQGWEWPYGATVSATVKGKSECSASNLVGGWKWGGNYVEMFFPPECSVAVGDEITLADGGQYTRTHSLQNLDVTEVNKYTDTVSGTADPGATIYAWPWDYSEMSWTAVDGSWAADFGGQGINLVGGMCGRAEIRDVRGNATAMDWCVPQAREISAGNFTGEWSLSNPEEVYYLSWKGSDNLVRGCIPPDCPGHWEFFGNSWVSENENTPDSFFAELVGGSTTGAWAQAGTGVEITSINAGYAGAPNIPIHTSYQFFNDPSLTDLIMITRTFEFGDTPYPHAVRPFIPRLFPKDGFTQVLHPDLNGTALVTDSTCTFGCKVDNWNGTWFAYHNPGTGLGMIVQRFSSPYTAALWVDDDDASWANASSFLLLQPPGGFTGTVTETEYLCFYDNTTWTPSLVLPAGCQSLPVPEQRWMPVNLDGFGDGNNNEITRMTIHEGQLYVSTDNDTTGGEMWRSANGVTWSQVNQEGFGSLENDRLQVESSINGYLYVGTGENPSASADIWRCALCDGTDWEMVTGDGFGDPNNTLVQRVMPYGDQILAAVDNSATGLEIWSSLSGAPGTWTQINQDGFGEKDNTAGYAASIFNGYFYIAAAQWGEAYSNGTNTGLEVWRCALCDGTDWEQVSLDGFGDKENNANSVHAYNGYLYVSTYNLSQGGEIWRCQACDGSDWVQVIGNGFGNPNNSSGGFMIEFQGVLYAIPENWTGGVEVWKTIDGLNWEMEGQPGFGDSGNGKSWAGAVFNDNLYLGTANSNNGCELWEKLASP